MRNTMQYAWLFQLDLITNNDHHKFYKSQSKIKSPRLSNRITSTTFMPLGGLPGHWAVGSLRSDCLSIWLEIWLVLVWAPRCTDFLLKSTRLLTPQVQQQQRWRIACILVVKRAFQHMTLREIPITKSRDLVLHDPGISGLKNGPGSRDSGSRDCNA